MPPCWSPTSGCCSTWRARRRRVTSRCRRPRMPPPSKPPRRTDMHLAYTLPLVVMGIMALAMIIYVVLEGYDLGVGILMFDADDAQKDRMVASIGPFWDANETWLVLGVGILL